MLFDPRWTRVTNEPGVMTVQGLIAWLESQDPSTRYRYTDPHDCLLSRYFRAKGYRWAYCGAKQFRYSMWFMPPLFSKTIPPEMDAVAVEGETNYGAALRRARLLA